MSALQTDLGICKIDTLCKSLCDKAVSLLRCYAHEFRTIDGESPVNPHGNPRWSTDNDLWGPVRMRLRMRTCRHEAGTPSPWRFVTGDGKEQTESGTLTPQPPRIDCCHCRRNSNANIYLSVLVEENKIYMCIIQAR